MATTREKIEHLEHRWVKDSDTPWQNWSYSRKWLKKQMNRYIRRQNEDTTEKGENLHKIIVDLNRAIQKRNDKINKLQMRISELSSNI